MVWAEQVSIKNGKFSTLAIAGGPGWESSGTFTIKADNGVETKLGTFSFNANPVQSTSNEEIVSTEPKIQPTPNEPKTSSEEFKEGSVSTSSTTKVEEFKEGSVSTSSLTK